MTRKMILDQALKCVTGDREQDYGSPENNFKTIAEFWSTYLDKKVTATDVAAMLSLLKLARIKSGHAKEDNWVDLAGYAACGGELQFPISIKMGETTGVRYEPIRWASTAEEETEGK